MNDNDFPLPPANLEYLVFSLKMQAEMHLGLLHFGEEKDRPAPDLRMARHFIDLLAVLQDKTKGNLGLEEQRSLDNSITELRFRYVQTVESTNRKAAEPTSGPEPGQAETTSAAEPGPAESSTNG
jgi:hypothetical protein